MQQVNIEWQGPLAMDDAKTLHSSSDYGIYQIYGNHPIYGMGVLLYIGKAQDQTFGRRLSQHCPELWVGTSTSVFVGRLAVCETGDNDWGELISRVEKLLIYAHAPSWNSTNIQDFKGVGELHILNWRDYGSLLPEISTERWDQVSNELPEGRVLYKD